MAGATLDVTEIQYSISGTEVTTGSGNLNGYKAVQQDGGKKTTIVYDSEFQIIDEQIEKLYENLNEFSEMDEDFKAAWDKVSPNLSDAMSDSSTLDFAILENDDIFVISEVGAVIAKITKWDGEDTWDQWNGESFVAVKNIQSSFNFHDADWNHLGSYGSEKRYLKNDQDNDVLSETGVRSFVRINKNDLDSDAWDGYKPAAGSISWDEVTEIEVGDNTWQGLDNELREDDFEEWTDTNTQIHYFTDSDDGEYTEFVGSQEARGGFLEIRDENWNTVARVADPSATIDIDAVEMQFSGITKAWSTVSAFLPVAAQDPKALKFAIDGDNIAVFTSDNAMIGRISNWTDTHTWERWDHDTQSFIDIEVQRNDFNFHDVDWEHLGNSGRENFYIVQEDGTKILDEYAENAYIRVKLSEVADKSTEWDIYDPNHSEIDWSEITELEIGTSTWTGVTSEFREEAYSKTDQQIRLYKANPEAPEGQYWNMFAGSVEKRDGFIEIRDENWNTIARVVDPSSADDFSDIEGDYNGLKEAWAAISTSLSSNLKDPNALKFTTDDHHIYAFGSDGTMLAQINFWSGDDTWSRWDHENQVFIEIKNVHWDYNFHDADWNNIASSGGENRFIVEDDGTEILDETGERAFIRLAKEDAGDDWNTYNPSHGAIDWASVTEIEVGSHTWRSVENEYRPAEEVWEDGNESVNYFKPDPNAPEGETWTMFAGSKTTEDGLIVIRDETWMEVARVVDLTSAKTFTEITTANPELEEAWKSLEADLPSALNDPDSLKFSSEDERINAFDSTSGELLAQIHYWSNTDDWQQWTGDGFRNVENEHWNFHFQDANWNHIGSSGGYERYVVKDDGTRVLDEQGTHKDIRVEKQNVADEDIATSWDQYNPNHSSINWDEVTSVEVGTHTNKFVENEWNSGDDLSGDSSSFTRFHGTISEGDYEHDVFLGSKETRDGYIEIRDQNWNMVERLFDVNSANVTSFEQLKIKYSGIDTAWSAIKDGLPSGLQNTSDLSFSNDEHHIYAFSSSGSMLAQINYWSDTNYWERWDHDTQRFVEVKNEHWDFNFHDANWNHLGSSGGGQHFLKDDNGAWVSDETNLRAFIRLRKDDLSNEDWDAYDPNHEAINWDNVGEIEVGTETWAREGEDPQTNEMVQFFKIVTSDDGEHNWTDFVGVKETRDGFIEIRDENWNTVGRVVDITAAASFEDISGDFRGLEQAWADILSALPAAASNKSALDFTTDENHIYAFDSSGVMILQINYWSGTDTWDHWDHDAQEFVTAEGAHWNYNFHDADWEHYGSAGGNERYLIDPDGNRTLDETGSRESFRIKKEDIAAEDLATSWEPYKTGNDAIPWAQVDEVEVFSNTWTRVGEDAETNVSYNYFRTVSSEDGQHDAHVFMGSKEIRDGFEELRDENWNTLVKTVDSTSTKTYDEITNKFSKIEEAWGEVIDFLPDELGSPSALKFSISEHDINVFDSAGAMVGIISQWTDEWDYTDHNNLKVEVQNFNFRFMDENYNELVSSGGEARYIVEDNGNKVLDEVNSRASYRMKKDDLELSEWNAFNPNNDAIDWSKVSEISFGTNNWESVDNDYRTSSYSDEFETIEFFEVVVSPDGDHTRVVFVGAQEIKGNLEELYDSNWNLVGSQIGDDATGYPLLDVLNSTDKEILEEFENELEGYFGDMTSLELINAGDGPGILINGSNEIEAVIYRDEWSGNNNGNPTLQYSYSMEDGETGKQFLTVGGWNELDSKGQPKAKPNGVNLTKVYEKDILTDQEWEALEQAYDLPDIAGFNWADVGRIEVGTYKDDNDGDGDYHEFNEIRFIEKDEFGWENWDYFRIAKTNGVSEVEQFSDEQGQWVRISVQTDIEDLRPVTDALGSNTEEILNNLFSIYGADADKALPGFSELSVMLSSEDNAVLVDDNGEIKGTARLHIDEQKNEDGHVHWEVDISGLEGENLFTLGGFHGLDESGEMEISEAGNGYKFYQNISKSSVTDDEWASFKENYMPQDNVFDDTAWNNTALLQLRYSQNDWDGDGDFSERFEVRFVNKDPSGGDGYDFEWDNNFRIRFEGDSEALFHGNNFISSSLGRGIESEPISSLADFSTAFASIVSETDLASDLFASIPLELTSGGTAIGSLDRGNGPQPFLMITEIEADSYFEITRLSDGQMLGWAWTGESDYGPEGNTGYEFTINVDTFDMPAEVLGYFANDYGPVGDQYQIYDIETLELSYYVNSDAQEDFYGVYHKNEEGDRLGGVGYDVNTGSKWSVEMGQDWVEETNHQNAASKALNAKAVMLNILYGDEAPLPDLDTDIPDGFDANFELSFNVDLFEEAIEGMASDTSNREFSDNGSSVALDFGIYSIELELDVESDIAGELEEVATSKALMQNMLLDPDTAFELVGGYMEREELSELGARWSVKSDGEEVVSIDIDNFMDLIEYEGDVEPESLLLDDIDGGAGVKAITPDAMVSIDFLGSGVSLDTLSNDDIDLFLDFVSNEEESATEIA